MLEDLFLSSRGVDGTVAIPKYITWWHDKDSDNCVAALNGRV